MASGQWKGRHSQGGCHGTGFDAYRTDCGGGESGSGVCDGDVQAALSGCTWNQILFEVDRLSRTGLLRRTRERAGAIDFVSPKDKYRIASCLQETNKRDLLDCP